MKESNSTIAGEIVRDGYLSNLRASVRPGAGGPVGRSHFPNRIPFNGVLTNKLLALLPGADFARLLPSLEPISLLAGDKIRAFGESSSFAYFPETAVIAHLYLLEDGSTPAVSVIGNDGMIGLSGIFESSAPLYETQITIGGTALRVSAEALRLEFARGGALQQVILNYASARMAQVSQKAVCNLRHKLDARLCTWLLMLQDRVREKALELTHEKIAHYLGTRRAGVSSACNVLREGGIINYQRGTIHILERDQLEAAACECYQTFRQIAQESLTA
jgi:CRP-like cAMP-binding protein